ncbi:Aspartic peptidase domain-containing protein [Strongyloides ratti]|uniref:Aspartic peptidase domain-containing protein n=1 Tax=Strongyloides ratti TaxID=34506 RepID=A0A090L085_STRRB|nr:Aspartic peptidase domain-containing protein [Strongyloides ratti]CEF61547.1 Aspartic peptidase domain-containing protein [Strongyloides ratti]
MTSWAISPSYDEHKELIDSYTKRFIRFLDLDGIVEESKKVSALITKLPDHMIDILELHSDSNTTYEQTSEILVANFGGKTSITTAVQKLKYFKLDWREDKLINKYQYSRISNIVSHRDEIHRKITYKENYALLADLINDIHSTYISSKRNKKKNDSHKRGSFKKKLHCNYCGYNNHLEKECLKKQNQSNSNDKKVNLIKESEISHGKLFIISLTINSKSVTTLIDSGATICLIKKSLSEKLYMRIEKSTSTLIYGRQNQSKLIGRGYFILKFGSFNIQERTEICNNLAMDPIYDFILGTTLLEKLGRKIFNFEENHITIKNVKIPLFNIIEQ